MHTAAKLTKVVVDFGLVCLVVVALVYTLGALGGVLDGPDDVQAAQDTEAAIQDALTQAQADRPDLWNDERVARGCRAGGSGGGAMKERPILFSGAMVRALLDGTKTQTRRIVKARDLEWMDVHQGLREPDNAERCPYGQPGAVVDSGHRISVVSEGGAMSRLYTATLAAALFFAAGLAAGAIYSFI